MRNDQDEDETLLPVLQQLLTGKGQALPPLMRTLLRRGGTAGLKRLFSWAFPYEDIDQLLDRMDQEHRCACQRFLSEHYGAFVSAPGSRHNHQAWPGGYQAHVAEVMNLGVVLYTTLDALRPLPFSLSSLLLVLFWHDAEKPFKFPARNEDGWQVAEGLKTKDGQRQFREELLTRFAVPFTDEERTAFLYVEGEGLDYSPTGRTMNGLGAVAHACDVLSARLWPDHPYRDDLWSGSEAYAADP